MSLAARRRRRIGAALGRIPQGLYLMTAADEEREGAVLVSWVQQVSFEPPMVVVGLYKGRQIVPLVHESHAFALSQLTEEDRLVIRKFGRGDDEEPLQGIPTTCKVTGSPVLKNAVCYLDCELVRHIDIDGDHDLYVGRVRDGAVERPDPVAIHLREDGLKY